MTLEKGDWLNRIKAKIQNEVTQIENREDLSVEQKATRIIHIFSAACAAAASQPLPFADIFILTPIQAYMGSRLSAIRGMPLSDAKANELLKEILGTIGMGMLAQQAALGLYSCQVRNIDGGPFSARSQHRCRHLSSSLSCHVERGIHQRSTEFSSIRIADMKTYIFEQIVCLFARMVHAWNGCCRRLPWLLDLYSEPWSGFLTPQPI